jgi:two-component system osmolarity sensor histidine kinase EnvZ
MLPDEFFREGLIYDVDDMDAILNQFISYMRDGSDEELKTPISIFVTRIGGAIQTLDIRFEHAGLPIIPARSLSLKRLIGNLINNANAMVLNRLNFPQS